MTNCGFIFTITTTSQSLKLIKPSNVPAISRYAKQNGVFLVIVSLPETPCDSMSEVLVREKVGDVLQAVHKKVIALNTNG